MDYKKKYLKYKNKYLMLKNQHGGSQVYSHELMNTDYCSVTNKRFYTEEIM